MKILVMGAGAVGCYFGGLLAKAGHTVEFVGRQSHVDAINARGLLVETAASTEYVPARAHTEPSRIATPDVVLVTVKSADTVAAGAALKPVLAPATVVLSLQNGVDNAERLSKAIGQPVIPTVVYVGVEMAGPGHVKHHGRGDIVMGPSPIGPEIAPMFQKAGIPTTVSSDINATLWTKLITNCAFNALSAAGRIPYGPLLEVPGVRAVISGVIRECVAVAAACGVSLPSDIETKTLAIPVAMPNQYSSTAQDLARGKPTEIDFLNGYVVRKGEELGVPTPSNQALQVITKLIERNRSVAGSA